MKNVIVAANAAHAPQQSSPAHSLEDSQPSTPNPAPAAPWEAPSLAELAGQPVHTGKPTLHGQPPPGMERRFAPAPAGVMPEWMRLPAPRERCPYSGASRSWLIDQEELGRIKIVRVRQPGRMRGACFVYLPSLFALLRGELEKQTPPASGSESKPSMENQKGGHHDGL